jgi:ribose-phosphate pyrophosphokinase
VKDKNVFIVDDIMDTGGTITKAAELMMQEGAKSVRAICTHPVLSGDAYKKLEDSKLEEIIVADTIPLKQELKKITVLSTAHLLAESIKRVINNESVSSLFIDPK